MAPDQEMVPGWAVLQDRVVDHTLCLHMVLHPALEHLSHLLCLEAPDIDTRVLAMAVQYLDLL